MADKRRLRVWLFAGALVVVVAGGWFAIGSGGGDDAKSQGALGDPTLATNAPLEDTAFPDVSLVRVSDGMASDPVVRGLPTVVNFWFSTCPPCRREMPVLARVADDYAGLVAFVGINPLDDAQGAEAFLKQFTVAFDTHLDPDGDLLAELGINSMPVTLFVDANRRIVAAHAGEITYDTLRGHLTDEFGIAAR